MRVHMDKEYRRNYTLEDIDRAKMVIAFEKENDEDTAKGWAVYAVNEAAKVYDDYSVEIIKADATTAKNYRAWNLYGDGSQDMDVWVEATAKTGNGFIEVGAYLSDIWQTGAVHYTNHMYIKYYKAV